MNCKTYKKQIVKYLDGELPEGLARQLMEHIESCKSCKQFYSQLGTVNNFIEAEKSEYQENPFLAQKVINKLKKVELHPTEQKSTIKYITIATLAAAGLVIGILIGSLFTSNIFSDSSSNAVYEQLADEYMPEVDNNPYNQIVIETEKTTKP